MNKPPANKFEWIFGTGCRFHVHGFDDARDGSACVCGLTILRQRRGGWDAVWNTRGVGFATTTRRPRFMRKRDWDELVRLCERALRENPALVSMVPAKAMASRMSRIIEKASRPDAYRTAADLVSKVAADMEKRSKE